jgi:hypothetical protein
MVDNLATQTTATSIKTETDQIGTIVNTGGAATIGAVLGDFANIPMVTKLAILTNATNGLAAIKTELESTSLATGAGSNATLTRVGSLLRWLVDNVAAGTNLTTLYNEVDATNLATGAGSNATTTRLGSLVRWIVDNVATAAGTISAGVNDFNATAKASIQTAVAAALAAVAFTRAAGNPQVKVGTIDLNQAAASYDLATGTTQDVEIERFWIRMSGGAGAGALTSISIQTNDTTAQVFISSANGAVANLADQNQLAFVGSIMLKTGKKVQLTIAGGATGAARACDYGFTYRALASGGLLA